MSGPYHMHTTHSMHMRGGGGGEGGREGGKREGRVKDTMYMYRHT